MAEETIFSKIINKEIPADLLYQDDLVTAFRDINPRAPSHILIIPNKLIPTTNDVEVEDEAMMGRMFTVARKLAKEEGIAEDGYRLIVNCIKKKIPRVTSNHEMDWVRACKEPKKSRVEASSNFMYSGPFNEVVVMGDLAIRLQDLKKKLEWDGEKMEITNIGGDEEIKVVTSDKFTVIEGDPKFDTKYATINAKEAAKEYIKHNYREGWKLPS